MSDGVIGPDAVRDATTDARGAASAPGPRRRVSWPGIAAAVLGVATAIGVVAGVLLATRGLFAEATIVSYLAIGASGLAVVGGLVAILGRWGRGAGILGVVLGVIANPLVLLYGLGALGRLGGL